MNPKACLPGVVFFKISILLLICFKTFSTAGQVHLLEKMVEATESHLQKNDSENAMYSARRIIELFPANPEGYLLRAKVYEMKGAQEAACTDLSLAIAMDPENPESRFLRGMIAYRINRFDLARTDFRMLLNTKNSITNTVFFRQNNFKGTDRITTMQSGPADQLYHLLGLVEIKAGNYRRAIQLLDSAILLNNREADMYAHRGLAYERIGEQVPAQRDFENAFRLDPAHSVTLANNAIKLRKEGSLAESIEKIGQAIRINPKVPDFYNERAFIRLENKEYELAVADYDSAIRLDPEDAELWFNRGLALEKSGKQTEAFESFGYAILRNERHERAWFMQGTLQLRKQEFKNAITSFTIALGLSPEYGGAYHNRAIAQFRTGQAAQACKDISMAVSLGHPGSAELQNKFCR